MVNKKGYIRTLEAVIGIVIILLFIFSVTPKHKEKTEEVPSVVKSSLDFMTAEINANESLRKAVYDDDNCKSTQGFCNENSEALPEWCNENCPLNIFIEDNIPVAYLYEYRICDNPSCVIPPPEIEASIYTADTFVSPPSDQIEEKPRLVRIWLWRAE